MSQTFYTLKVSGIRREAPDAVTITFEIPENVRSVFQYKHGQFITLRRIINGLEVRRSYSICSAPFEKQFSITAKMVKNGKISPWLTEELKINETIEVLPPEGVFTCPLDSAQRKAYYFFAAGSGITPVFSIIKAILEEEPKSDVHLLYGSRDEEHIIFKEELDQLQSTCQGQFFLEYTLSKPIRVKDKGLTSIFSKGKINWAGKTGRIDVEMAAKFLENHPARTNLLEFFLCGPQAMMDVTAQLLLNKGFDKKNIHQELFFVEKTPEHSNKNDHAKVTAWLNGKSIQFEMDTQKTIIDALIEKKYNPPYSCSSGACATCIAKVISGEVKMDRCYALDEEEVAGGLILTCQSHPVSKELEITYDI